MKQDCERIFIELISPYLSATAIAKAYRKDDWHEVFKEATALRMETALAGDKIRLLYPTAQIETGFYDKLNRISDNTNQLIETAVKAEHDIMKGEKLPSPELSSEAFLKIAEIQNDLRSIIIDSVCTCEMKSET